MNNNYESGGASDTKDLINEGSESPDVAWIGSKLDADLVYFSTKTYQKREEKIR